MWGSKLNTMKKTLIRAIFIGLLLFPSVSNAQFITNEVERQAFIAEITAKIQELMIELLKRQIADLQAQLNAQINAQNTVTQTKIEEVREEQRRVRVEKEEEEVEESSGTASVVEAAPDPLISVGEVYCRENTPFVPIYIEGDYVRLGYKFNNWPLSWTKNSAPVPQGANFNNNTEVEYEIILSKVDDTRERIYGTLPATNCN